MCVWGGGGGGSGLLWTFVSDRIGCGSRETALLGASCLEEERVPEADRLEEGGELVVAVLAAADDAQEEVDLGGGEELQVVVGLGRQCGQCGW